MEPIPINHHSYDSDDDFVAKRKIKSAEKVTEMCKWPLVDKENQKPVDNFSDDLLFDANSCFTHVKRRKLVSADVNVPKASKYNVTIKDINEDTSSENGDDSDVDVDYDHFENDLNIVDNTEHDDNDFLLQTEFITSGDNHDKF